MWKFLEYLFHSIFSFVSIFDKSLTKQLFSRSFFAVYPTIFTFNINLGVSLFWSYLLSEKMLRYSGVNVQIEILQSYITRVLPHTWQTCIHCATVIVEIISYPMWRVRNPLCPHSIFTYWSSLSDCCSIRYPPIKCDTYLLQRYKDTHADRNSYKWDFFVTCKGQWHGNFSCTDYKGRGYESSSTGL